MKMRKMKLIIYQVKEYDKIIGYSKNLVYLFFIT